MTRFLLKNMKIILGKKLGMSQVFDETGKVIPVTLLEAGPCKVLEVLNKEKNGYDSIQLGFIERKEKKALKSGKGKNFTYIKEFRGEGEFNVGDTVDVSIFEEGDMVKVSGVSKGKGFQGGVKRHGMSGRDRTHGVKHDHRTIGSVGSAWPQRVIKGRHMPGRMGADRVSVKNLKVIKIDKENNTIAVKGAIPGHYGTLIEVRG